MNEQSTRHQGLESFSLDAPLLAHDHESSGVMSSFGRISKEMPLPSNACICSDQMSIRIITSRTAFFAHVQKYAIRATASSRRKTPNLDLKSQFSRGK